MDCLINNDTLAHMLLEYGSIVLFILLMLGIVALPIPEETLLVFAGALMAQGILHPPSTIIAASTGSLCGITVSYLLGLTGGHYLVHKYGKWVGITTERLNQAKAWFERFGKWSLFIGYFIPGVRHFTGFTAGTTKLEYHHFSLFAYSGGIVWITTFLSIGYFFGDICFAFIEEIDFKTVMIIGTATMAVLIYAIWRSKRNNKG